MPRVLKTPGGTVTKALADAREAAADRPSMQLRNDAAFLLGRPDLVALPGGTFVNPEQFFLLNLTQRQFLRLSYRKDTPAKNRAGGKAEIVPLDGGPALPLPEDFVATHEWGLKFDEGGTILADAANHRWLVPGTKDSAERPPANDPDLEAEYRLKLPKYERMESSSDGRWTAAFCDIGSAEHALHIFKDGKPGPVLVNRQLGGKTQAAFLDPPHVLATGSRRGRTWIEDLFHGQPAVRLPASGTGMIFSPAQGLFGFHGWEYDEIRTYAWRPSAVLHSFSIEWRMNTVARFSPDERWLCTCTRSGYHWWSLDPLRLDQPARTDQVPGAFNLFFQTQGAPAVTLVSLGTATEYTFTSTADGPSLLTNPRPTAWKQEDLPGLRQNLFQATASPDGRIVALGGKGPIGVWRDGKLWREFSAGDFARLSLSPDGRLIAIGAIHDHTVKIWDLEGQNGQAVPLHEERFVIEAMVNFSPDGRWLSCSGEEEIRVLDTASWKVVAKWPREVRHLGWTSFSDDGKLLLIQQTQEDIALLRTGTWEQLLLLQSPVRDYLYNITLSPSGHWLTAAAGFDGARWLWDLHALERELRSMGLGW